VPCACRLVKEEEVPEEERLNIERPAKRQARDVGKEGASGGGGASALNRAKAAIAARLAGAADRGGESEEDEE
jgi:hypothetical protein